MDDEAKQKHFILFLFITVLINKIRWSFAFHFSEVSADVPGVDSLLCEKSALGCVSNLHAYPYDMNESIDDGEINILFRTKLYFCPKFPNCLILIYFFKFKMNNFWPLTNKGCLQCGLVRLVFKESSKSNQCG
jgi:hypothetical protein